MQKLSLESLYHSRGSSVTIFFHAIKCLSETFFRQAFLNNTKRKQSNRTYFNGSIPITSIRKLVKAGLVGLLCIFGQRCCQPFKVFWI